VGGDLDLRGLTSIPEGFNPTVGGDLYLRGNLKANKKSIPKNYIFSWQNGKYILVDGIFSGVINRKNNIYKIRKIAKKEIITLITDGNGNWAHGASLKEAKTDLIFKITDKTKSDYENLKVNDILSFEKAIVCYRVITGACSFGVKEFVKSIKPKKQYSISEIIELTKNEYGGKTFKQFFV
jgi:hypothetical protein